MDEFLIRPMTQIYVLRGHMLGVVECKLRLSLVNPNVTRSASSKDLGPQGLNRSECLDSRALTLNTTWLTLFSPINFCQVVMRPV